MGILDALFGGGSMMQMDPSAAAQPFSQRLTSGMGAQGGMLGKMGLGDHPQQPGQAGMSMGKPGGLLDLLKQQGQPSRGQPMAQNYFPPAPQAPQQMQASQQAGQPQNLQQLIQAWMAQNSRGA